MKLSFYFALLFSFLQVIQISSYDIKSKEITKLNREDGKRKKLDENGMEIESKRNNGRQLFMYEDIGCMYGMAAAAALAYIVVANSNGEIVTLEYNDKVLTFREKLGMVIDDFLDEEEIREREDFFNQLITISKKSAMKQRNRLRRGRIFIKKEEEE